MKGQPSFEHGYWTRLDSIDKLSVIFESGKSRKCHVKRDQVSFGLRILVIAISDVDSP